MKSTLFKNACCATIAGVQLIAAGIAADTNEETCLIIYQVEHLAKSVQAIIVKLSFCENENSSNDREDKYLY